MKFFTFQRWSIGTSIRETKPALFPTFLNVKYAKPPPSSKEGVGGGQVITKQNPSGSKFH